MLIQNPDDILDILYKVICGNNDDIITCHGHIIAKYDLRLA